MKSILLLMMMLAAGVSPVFGQKQLPASLQPYAVNWGYSVKQMFQAAGYDVPGPKASFELVPAIKNRSNEPQLDSTITYYGYDVNHQDSLPLMRNVYTYPQDGMQVNTEYFYDFDHWTPLSRTVMIFDELDRMVDAFSQVYDDAVGDFIPDSRIEFYPHENSLTEADSFFVLGWSVEFQDWYRLFSVWNSFDDAGRLKESLSSTTLFEFPIVFLDRYHYNNDGDLSGIESFNIDNGEEYPASRESFWYVDHLLQLSTIETSDGFNGWIAESKKEYTYTPFRKEELVKSFIINLQTNDWELNQVIGYVYDSSERILQREETSSTEDGGWDRLLKTFDYFQDENLASEGNWSYDNQVDDWVLQDKTYYYYNGITAYEPVDPITIGALTMWPNPASGIVQFGLEGSVSLQVFGPAGQLVRQHELNSGEKTLDISALPSGAYYVKAKSEDGHYAGTLIIQQ